MTYHRRPSPLTNGSDDPSSPAQRINGRVAGSALAQADGYHTPFLDINGNVLSAINGATGVREDFKNGLSPERYQTEQLRAQAGGNGGTDAPAAPAPNGIAPTAAARALSGSTGAAVALGDAPGRPAATAPTARTPVARQPAAVSTEPSPEQHDMMVQWARERQASGGSQDPMFKGFGHPDYPTGSAPVGTGPQQASQRAVAAADQAGSVVRPASTAYGATSPATPVPIDQQPASVRLAPGTRTTPGGGSVTVGTPVGAPALTGSPTGIYVNGQPAYHGADDASGRPSLVTYDPARPPLVTRLPAPADPAEPAATATASGLYDPARFAQGAATGSTAAPAPPLAAAGQPAYVPPAGPPEAAPAPKSAGTRAALAVRGGVGSAVDAVKAGANTAVGAVNGAWNNAGDFVDTLVGATPPPPGPAVGGRSVAHARALPNAGLPAAPANPGSPAVAAAPSSTLDPGTQRMLDADRLTSGQAAPFSSEAARAQDAITRNNLRGAPDLASRPTYDPVNPSAALATGAAVSGSPLLAGLFKGFGGDTATAGPGTPDARPAQGLMAGGSLDAATPTVSGGPTTPSARPAQGLSTGTLSTGNLAAPAKGPMWQGFGSDPTLAAGAAVSANPVLAGLGGLASVQPPGPAAPVAVDPNDPRKKRLALAGS